ncbi:hypothetical protein D3C75_1147480 [compost metagenome]
MQAETLLERPLPANARTPAYYVAELEVTDAEGIKPYRDQVDATFRPYGGRYIVRAGQMDRLEGTPPNHRLIIIEFDSLQKARAWYHSPEYAKIRPIRQHSGTATTYIIEGVPQR